MKRLSALLALLMLVTLFVQAQPRQVTGTVTGSDDGMPLLGVSIQVKGTTTGGVTDMDGKFSLNVPAGSTSLVFSFVGYKAQEVAIEGRTIINVILETESLKVQEVIVTALGISRDKKAIGYASTSLSGDDISATKAINPMSALQGKVAGMDISSAPGPGSTQNVMIRGASSFGNNQPLYIIDGVPITNAQNQSGSDINDQVDFGSGVNAINPDDIKDITVLKGAAATALYGSRAANGVIMITSKSGSNTEGKIQITYDASATLSRVGRLPDEQTQFGQGWGGDRKLDENGNWGAAFDGKDRVWGRIIDNSQQIKKYSYVNDRVRDFYDFGTNYKNSVSLTGGTAKTNYYVSFSQNSVDGVVPTSKDSYNRFTIATRGEHNTGKLKISSSFNFSTEKTSAVASGQGNSMHRSLYEIANDISIVDLKDYKNKFNTLDNYFTPYGLNPYYVLDANSAVQDKNKFYGKAQLDYNVFDKLKLTYRFGGDFETSIGQTHTGVIAFTPGSFNESSSSKNPGAYAETRRERIQVNHDFMANYSVEFNEDLKLNAIAGVNINDRQYSFLNGYITSVDVPGYYNLNNSTTPPNSSQYSEQRRLVGAYGNADFSYKNYAYLTLTARNDWSSTLPKESNSFFYPGATVSVLVTELLESKGISTGIVSFAKLRGAYGMTGNDATQYYVYNRYVSATSTNPGYPGVDVLSFPLNGVNSYSVSDRLGNDKLKPELTTEFELGGEVKFFDNRVGFDVSYYDKYTKGLIQVLPKDPSSGFTSQMSNLGDISNKGVEIVFDVTPIRSKDFNWNISVNYAANKNKVENLDVPEINLAGFGGGAIYAVEGKALGQFKFTRAQTVVINGVSHTVVDGAGIPLRTTDAEYFGKDVNEKFRLGLTNTFSYKGLTLTGTLDFRYGGYMYSNTKEYMHWTGSGPETVLNDRNPLIVPNSVVANSDGTYSENITCVDPTKLHDFYSQGGFEGESFSIIDRSYLKLRNIGLSYDLPKNTCSKIGVKGIKLSLNASNILLWTPAENAYIDPETTTFGNDIGAKFGEFGANPSEEMYTFGLNLIF